MQSLLGVALIAMGIILLTRSSEHFKSADDEERAMLTRLINNTDKIVSHLKKKFPKDPRTERLASRWTSELRIMSSRQKQAAKTIDKSQIYICLKGPSGKLYDANTAQFVLLHELAHMASKKYGHGEEFWINMNFLIYVAVKEGVYKYEKYESFPVNYCGQDITSNPYTDCHENNKCELF